MTSARRQHRAFLRVAASSNNPDNDNVTLLLSTFSDNNGNGVQDIGETFSQPILVQVKSAALGDYVWLDKNADGIQDTDEEGIDGITVKLWRDLNNNDHFDSDEVLQTTVTGDNPHTTGTVEKGYYQFSGLIPGLDYQVLFGNTTTSASYSFSPRYASAGTPETDSNANPANGESGIIQLPAGLFNRTIDAGLYESASLGDTVFVDNNGNGVFDTGDVAKSEVVVNLYYCDTTQPGNKGAAVLDGNNQPLSDTTDAGGQYLFEGLKPGQYVVEFVLPTGYSFTTPSQVAADVTNNDSDAGTGGLTGCIELSSGENERDVDAGLYESASLGDTVFVDNNGNGVFDTGDVAKSEVVVNLYYCDTTQPGNKGAAVLDGNNQPLSDTTDAGGQYLFEGLKPGQYVVEFVLPTGYSFTTPSQVAADVTNNDSDAGTGGLTGCIELSSGENERDVDAGLYESASLGDTVFVDNNGNGVFDTGDVAKSEVVVNLYYCDTTQPGNKGAAVLDGNNQPLSDTTDAGGQYLFEGLKPGQYVVEFVLPTGYSFTTPSQVAADVTNNDSDAGTGGLTGCIELSSGENERDVDAGLYESASLGDTVFVDNNGNGVFDTGDVAKSEVVVNLYYCDTTQPGNKGAAVLDGNNQPLSDTTDAGGQYLFEGLKPGQYVVEFVLPTGYSFTTPSQVAADVTNNDSDAGTGGLTGCIELSSGENERDVDAGLYESASLGDTVFVDNNGNGVFDTGDVAKSEVVVNLYYCDTTQPGNKGAAVLDGNNQPLSDTTDAGGQYLFEGLKPGQYVVEFVLPTGYSFTTPSQVAADVTNNDSDAGTGGLTGCIELSSGENERDVDAGLYESASLGDTVFVDNNGNGVFDTGDVAKSEVVVNLYYCDTTQPGNKGAAVLDGNNQPLSDTTDAGGQYLFEGLKPGQYVVEFVLPTGYSFTTPSQVAADVTNNDSDAGTGGLTGCIELSSGENERDVDAGLYESASLGDTVFVDNNGNGVFDTGDVAKSEVVVNLYYCDTTQPGNKGAAVLDGNNQPLSDTTDAGGQYLFEGLKPGQYVVEFVLPTGYSFTTPSQVAADVTNNDSDAGTGGLTGCIELSSGENERDVDAGLVGLRPGIDIEKTTNGASNSNPVAPDYDNEDSANGAGVPLLTAGSVVNWTYQVTNTGNTTFAKSEIAIVDDNGTPANTADDFSVANGKINYLSGDVGNDNFLSPGEVWLYKASGIVQDLTALGAPRTFDFSGNSALDGTDGNIRTFSSGAVSVKASAFARDKASGEWSTAWLGSYGGGLGVTDSSEGSGGSNMHTVDNVGRDNYVLFEFNQSVIVDSAYLGYVVNDSDITVWIGTSSNAFNSHLTLSDAVLNGLGFTEVNLTDLTSARTADINAGNLAGNVLVLAAWTGDSTPEDRFKIEKLTFQQPTAGGVYENKATVTAPGAAGDFDLSHYKNPVLASIGDYVWVDGNNNGQQDDGAASGLNGVTVKLYTGAGAFLASTTTANDGSGKAGYYLFNNLVPGDYKLEFIKPAGYAFAKQDIGADGSDSDANPVNGMTVVTTLSSGENDLSWDAGLVVLRPGIDIEKTTNGASNSNPIAPDYDNEDSANGAGVPLLTPGSVVNWTYQVTNTGNTTFAKSEVGIVDDNGTPANTADDFSVANGKITYLSGDVGNDNLLSPGEVWLYKASGIVQNLTGAPGASTTLTLSGNSALDGTDGNIREFSSGAVSVKASAFARDKASGAWSTAWLGSYGGGLGVTDSSEGNGSNNAHTVDNIGRDNYVLFEFNQSVIVDKAALGYVVGDSDITVWIGNSSNAFNNHLTLSDTVLQGLGFTEVNLTDSSSARTADINAGNVAGNVLVIAAWTGDSTPEDQFKIEKLIVQQPTSGEVYENKATVSATGAPGDFDLSHYKNPVLASIGDYVWVDANNNGQQDDGSASGLNGVTVKLYTGAGVFVASTTTANDGSGKAGYYLFNNLVPGDYKLEFIKPAGYTFAKQDIGADGSDSDANPVDGMTVVTTLSSGENDLSWDAGLVVLRPGIDIEKTTNGASNSNPFAPNYDNEDSADGAGVPLLTPGTVVNWTYQVSNTGNTTFAKSEIAIVDDNGTPANTADDFSVANGKITYLSGDVGNDNFLSPGEVWLYKASGIVQDLTALGAPRTFDFSGNSALDGTDGNIRTFSSGAVSVKASAFARDKASGEWSTAWLGSYGGGLGVTDSSEGSGGSNMHTVDNVGRDNYVLFEFNQSVIVDSAYLGYVVNDSDITVWIGTSSNAFNSHLTLSDAVLNGLGFTEVNLTDLTSARTADINAGNLAGNVLVLAAWTGDSTPEDRFKIEKLTFQQPTTGGVYENKATVSAPGAPGDFDLSHYKNQALASIGDRVWCDTNGNGLQDTGEAGVAGVTVKLFNSAGTFLQDTTTDGRGNYSFTNLVLGKYELQFVKPTAFGGFTVANEGGNDALDSDVGSSGKTGLITLVAGENNGWDAGLTPPRVNVTYDFSGNSATDGSNGNVRSYTVDGITVNARAVSSSSFDRDGQPTNWETAWLGAYSGGHGVTDRSEGDGRSSNTHTVDNVGRINYVIYEFSEKVVVDKAFLGYVIGDSDLTAWIGSLDGPVSLSNPLAGLTKEVNDTSSTSARWADINSAQAEGNVLVVAARLPDSTTGSVGDNTSDYFKIEKLVVSAASKTVTPIAIDLDGNGIQTTSLADAQGQFDLFGNGSVVKSGWLSAGDAFLAFDADGNGRIDDISELFGGSKQGDGFARLAAFDSNGDGLVDAADDGYVNLSVWRDANGNHQTDPGELISLADAGVVSVNVAYHEDAFWDVNGNLHLEQSSATMANGDVVDMTDLYFSVAANDGAAVAEVPVSDPGWLFA
ncbi:SdrD B-like domain-containing protein [Candidatus Accumulibacter sp. ACC007]|uniref:SdrD B-like domain-containing protein n=1 Tax=Candidatus Accumulibacter sp. ACC007 TaxID=2823333 RepID=UPI0025C6A624|nr:SdrD B-like domain-containing protein [Candidatus Accumulibacter sp. ACC007]